ncbi:Laminin subunit alpha1like, partial [Caligus rogercresseyi]
AHHRLPNDDVLNAAPPILTPGALTLQNPLTGTMYCSNTKSSLPFYLGALLNKSEFKRFIRS